MTTKKSNDTLSEALSIATAVAYTKKEVDKLKHSIDSLREERLVEIEGPVGPTGPRGFIGPKGDKGDKGDTGLQGERGIAGPQGPQGPKGVEGPAGARGPQGDKGDKGDKGDTGDIGPQGPVGPIGAQGLPGEKGDKGDTGAKGDVGADGRDGANGKDGRDGRNGLDGKDGLQGPKGERGVAGVAGPKGEKGDIGPQGERGDKGEKGDKGDAGKDADIKPVEEKFEKFISNIQKDISAFKTKVNAAVIKAGGDAFKATGSGEVNLRYLDDVDRDSIQNGYVLSYNEVTGKFTFVSPTAGSFTPTDVTQVFAEVKNAESVTITKGQAVYLFGAVGNRASVKLANNTGDPTSAKTLGLVYSASIAPNGTGYIITQGVVTGVDTQAYNAGDTLYLANTNGGLTSTKPYAPQHLVYIGVVERNNQGQGQIYVRPQNGYELNEIHDVRINHTFALSNNDVLVYNQANTLWENKPISYLSIFGTDNLARSVSNSSFSTANSALSIAQSAFAQANTGGAAGTDNLARSIANSAFATANTKSYTFSQNTAPLTANTNDFWANTDSGIVYYNFGNTSSPVWVEFGPTGISSGETGNTDLTGYAVNTTLNLVWSTTNSAYAQANSASTLAQAAYNYANTIVVPSLSGYAVNTIVNLIWSTTNSAYSTANSAYTKANTSTTLAQSAYDAANSKSTFSGSYNDLSNKPDLTVYLTSANLTPYATTATTNTIASDVSSAWSTANSAWAQANTPQTQLVNGSDTLSLDGFSKVNLPGGTSYIFSATNNITLAPDNTGNNYLEIVNNTGATISTDRGFEVRTNADGTDRVWTFTQGGSLFFPDSTYQTTAFTGTAIDSLARTTANSAYDQANTATTNAATANNQAASAFAQANTATTNAATADTKAGNAYNQANTATTNASTADTKAGNAWSTANSAYSQANTATTNAASANTKAQSAWDGANLAYSTASNVYGTVGIVAIQVQDAYDTANSAWSKANSAFDKANTAITTSGGTATGSITANSATAFIAGSAAISGVALQVPSEGALRNLTNGSTNMYFDVSIGGTSQGQFQFRSSSSYTNILTMSPTAVTFNTDATFTSRTPSLARTAFNSAIDTEITVDSMRFRISNQGGIFPQVIGNGSSRNLAWTGVGAISGSAVTQVGSTGTIVASNAWTTLYNAHGMDSAGDTVTVTLQDKAAGRIYRITFMRSDNGSTTGYNIIGERIL